MIDGASAVRAFRLAGITHAIWLPDSELGTWEKALTAPDGLPLLRVCREGEAFALAAGLWIGGQRPIVLIQCTGLFEAGDSLRNIIHDLRIPLPMVIGVRSYFLHQQGKSKDSCPVFTEPILKAWNIPYQLFDGSQPAEAFGDALKSAIDQRHAFAALIAE